MSPTPTQIQNQLGKMRHIETQSTPQSISRQNSGAAFQNISRQNSGDSITSSIQSGGRETPASYRDIQSKYGGPASPRDFILVAGKTPMSDVDYQKTARQTVMGELSK